MFHRSHDLAGRRPVELDSEETYDFSAPKTCADNRLSNSDEPGEVRRNSVDSSSILRERTADG
jgi:hypothetical protein